ncbi:50S ribosomal protein L22 [Candidatus Saccharibacteria bacterium CPR2]|nr:50S ribosomal protein L22 [Candidatus Saccharibacteria bacterium CPR2]
MNNKVTAISKGVLLSPRKVGVVADLVRGRSVKDALVILEHTPRRAAIPVSKAIASAKANAQNNLKLSEDSLVLSEITVSHGARMKRYRPAAHGRALPYKKRSSHIKVVLEGTEIVKKKSAVKSTKTSSVKDSDNISSKDKKEKA